MVSMLVDSDELTDESDKVRQIRVRHELVEDWADASWEPEPIDASPGKLTNAATESFEDEKCVAHESALGWPLIVSLAPRLYRIPHKKTKRHSQHAGGHVRFERRDRD